MHELTTVRVCEAFEPCPGEVIEVGTILQAVTEREARRNKALLCKGQAEPICDAAKKFFVEWIDGEKEKTARNLAIKKREKKERRRAEKAARKARLDEFYQKLTAPPAKKKAPPVRKQR